MTDFEVSRIVPSTRDFRGAVRTRRNGLALVPLLPAADTAAHASRLEGIDVRALAIRESGEPCMAAARATESTPIALLAPRGDTEGCQRARFFGADAVSIAADAYDTHAKTVQSMRMMPLARVTSPDEVTAAIERGARVLVLAGEIDDVLVIAADVEKSIITVADVANADTAALERLNGAVDAAIVPVEIHASEAFEALLDRLDG